jgi:AraC family transcriptional regulator
MTTASAKAFEIDKVWGPAKAIGAGSLGLSARLSSVKAGRGVVERVRPKWDETHAISVWVKGASRSDLYLDGKKRFSALRDRSTFQLARAGESVRAILSGSTGECVDLYLPEALLSGFVESEFSVGKEKFELMPIALERDAEIVSLASRVAEEIDRPSPASEITIDGATLLLSAALIGRWSNLAPRLKSKTGGLAPWQVRRVLDLMHARNNANVSLSEFSTEVGLSPYHFARAFKLSVGESPHRHHLRIRFDRARDLIETTDMKISEIAFEIGYEDVSFFSKMFRTFFNVRPSEYRAQGRL